MKFIAPASIHGTIQAPASKSDMLRAVAAAYLTHARCELLNPSFCDDANAALGIVEALGTQIERTPGKLIFTPGTPTSNPTLNCGESGLCIRMFPSIIALRDDEITLTGHGSLSSRPIGMIEAPLRDLGVTCTTHKGLLPVTVKGPLCAGKTTVDGSTTSQFLTGLLMALPLCAGQSEIVVTNLQSAPYIQMTLNLLQAFGIEVRHEYFERFQIAGPQKYRRDSYQVEGDWSGAAFPLVAGAITGRVRIEQIRNDSAQADKAILDALKLAGAQVVLEANAVEVTQRPLSGFEFDAADCPDLFPPLVALACCCQGKTEIYGAHRLKVKESDRGVALRDEFNKMGGQVTLFPDYMEIVGKELDGGVVESYNDHRIAMACAVAALRSKHGVSINGWECVAKSYPQFFKDLEVLTAM